MAFAQTVLNTLSITRRSDNPILAAYLPGNCGEFIAIVVTVCRQQVTYKSLCFSRLADEIYKMCEYCRELQLAFQEMGINVVDIWNCSALGRGEPQELEPEEGYSRRALMTYNDITQLLQANQNAMLSRSTS